MCFRPDGNQHNLRSAAYEALMEMVKNSPKVGMRLTLGSFSHVTFISEIYFNTLVNFSSTEE